MPKTLQTGLVSELRWIKCAQLAWVLGSEGIKDVELMTEIWAQYAYPAYCCQCPPPMPTSEMPCNEPEPHDCQIFLASKWGGTKGVYPPIRSYGPVCSAQKVPAWFAAIPHANLQDAAASSLSFLKRWPEMSIAGHQAGGWGYHILP